MTQEVTWSIVGIQPGGNSLACCQIVSSSPSRTSRACCKVRNHHACTALPYTMCYIPIYLLNKLAYPSSVINNNLTYKKATGWWSNQPSRVFLASTATERTALQKECQPPLCASGSRKVPASLILVHDCLHYQLGYSFFLNAPGSKFLNGTWLHYQFLWN